MYRRSFFRLHDSSFHTVYYDLAYQETTNFLAKIQIGNKKQICVLIEDDKIRETV